MDSDLHPAADAEPGRSAYRHGVNGSRAGSTTQPPHIGESLPRSVRLAGRYSVVALAALQSFIHVGDVSADRGWLIGGLWAIVAAAWIVVPTRRRGDLVDQVALILSVGAGCGLHVLTGNGQVYLVGYATLFVGPFWYGMPEAIGPYVSGVLAVGLCTAYVGREDILGGIGNALGAAFFGLAAMFWGRILRASQRNAQLVEELQASRESERRSAAVAERARLARELHDVLAHTLSSLSLHLESTRVLGRSRQIDAEVLSRIDRAVGLARTGLEEARDALGTLRDDDLPGPERIPSLVEEFARTSGVDCRFEQAGTPVPLRPEAKVALFRGAQEALTNVGKHAAASRVEVCLRWLTDGVTLRVCDDGRGTGGAPIVPGSGNGLRGMRERAELAGGAVDAGPVAAGFVVELRLPA